MTKRKISSTWGGGHFQHSDIQSSTFFSTDEWWFDIGGNKSILGVQFKNCRYEMAFWTKSWYRKFISMRAISFLENLFFWNHVFSIYRITTLDYPCEEIFARPSRCCLMTTSMMIIISSWSQSTHYSSQNFASQTSDNLKVGGH